MRLFLLYCVHYKPYIIILFTVRKLTISIILVGVLNVMRLHAHGNSGETNSKPAVDLGVMSASLRFNGWEM